MYMCTVTYTYRCTVASSFYIPRQCTVASSFYIPRQCTVVSQKTYTSRGTGDFCRTPVTGTAADARFSRHLSFILVRLVLWVSMNNCEFFFTFINDYGYCQSFPPFFSLLLKYIFSRKKYISYQQSGLAPEPPTPHFRCSDFTVRLKSGRTLRHSKIHEEGDEGGIR